MSKLTAILCLPLLVACGSAPSQGDDHDDDHDAVSEEGFQPGAAADTSWEQSLRDALSGCVMTMEDTYGNRSVTRYDDDGWPVEATDFLDGMQVGHTEWTYETHNGRVVASTSVEQDNDGSCPAEITTWTSYDDAMRTLTVDIERVDACGASTSDWYEWAYEVEGGMLVWSEEVYRDGARTYLHDDCGLPYQMSADSGEVYPYDTRYRAGCDVELIVLDDTFYLHYDEARLTRAEAPLVGIDATYSYSACRN